MERLKSAKVKELYVFEGMGKKKVTEVIAGDLCAVVGIEDFNIGDTIADIENPEALPVISVDEPTMNMLFSVSTILHSLEEMENLSRVAIYGTA